MNSKTRSWTLKAMAGALLLAACSGPVVPITPDTLAGCWTGEALGLATAKVNIAKGTEPNVYTVDGEGKFGGNAYPIKNIQIEYDISSGELKPRGVTANLPFKLKVDGGEIKATATGTPFSINLKRCAGSTPPATTSPSPSPSAN